jgi:hypothetical protein
MRPRSLLVFLLVLGLLVLGFARATFAGDAVAVKISHFGIEGIYSSPSEPTWIQIALQNNTTEPIHFNLSVAEVSLDNGAQPLSEVVTLPLALAASETRTVDVPLRIVTQNHAVLYVQALDEHGIPLGRTGISVGQKPNGEIIALLCSTPDLCRAIRQSILLSGSAEEQTQKSQALRLIQLSEAPPAGWAYSPADSVVLAAPIARFSSSQRDALEIYLHRGGKLVLVDDQVADAPEAASHSRFLEAYRTRIPEGKVLHVGEGEFAHLKSVSSHEFSDTFRPLGFTPNTPEEIRNQLRGLATGNAPGEPGQLNSWLIRRLGTTFHFPSFFELLCWITGYLILVGVVNFIILRRIGRPEWAWITIPALAILFSLLLYAVGARNHPSNFGFDEMTVYRLDSLSPLAINASRVRISAPVRSIVRPVLPGDLVPGTGERSRSPYGARPQFAFNGESQFLDEVQLGDNWETSIPLRRWSFRDFQFEGLRRFAGLLIRDKLGRVHNETGLNYRQAIIVDQRDVFFLGEFPAGAIVDLAHVPHQPYEQETGRHTSGAIANFPAPPFEFKHSETEESASEQWVKRSDEEFKRLPDEPFALVELIRGWPKRGENVFSDTKAVFFGLSSEATLGATLRDRLADRKAVSLTVVTFGEWP